jgi:serine/threonine protein kinase
MTPDRWRKITAIFHAALACESSDRTAFVATSCGNDVELWRDVVSMLAAHDEAGARGETPGLVDARTLIDSALGIALTPGELFAERYRIVSLLGRGGMGDVYRADDLRIGEPVALKFLSHAPAHAKRIERFIREARLARQIAHPNVCRVYDIGEWNARLYLSMEYIEGEDLECLLKRVGPLPAEKALDVAHQLCAGLAAAHERGILHLDLKPANVMIDARGRAIITDFGVARAAEEKATTTVAGTPAYMPPEQLAGGALTAQTDLYALGLLMFEIFTGSRVSADGSIVGPATTLGRGDPLLSSAVALDPAVEAAIRGCLQREMEDRPHSAMAVTAALPCAESFAAALAAGRTPSPDIVAAARRAAVSPAVVALLTTALIVGLSIISLLNRSLLANLAPPLSPSVLVARAHEIIRSLGYVHPPADGAYWFTWNDSYREQALDRSSPFRPVEGDPQRTSAKLRFVYRESPARLVPGNIFGMVLYRDPPAEVVGMVDVNLDGHGRLLRFVAVPGHAESAPLSAPRAFDWDPLLKHAGLRSDSLSSVVPTRIPPVAYDTRAEWQVAEDGLLRRATAAAFDGNPVYFDIDSASASMGGMVGDRPAMSRLTSDPTVVFVLTSIVLAGAVLLARRHALRGQADKRGAWRLALYYLALNVLAILLLPDHVHHFGEEYFLVAKLLGWSLYWCASAAVLYLAFEPLVRRRWPAMLVGWTRILAGRVRDPIVGRDVLVGAVAGTFTVGIMWLAYAAGAWLNLEIAAPFRPALESFREPRHLAVHIIFLHTYALSLGLGGLFALAVLDRVLRAKWLAIAAWGLVFLAMSWSSLAWGSDWKLALQAGLAQAAVAVLVVVRFGPLALAAMLFTNEMLTRSPAALEFSAWYSNRSLIAITIVLAIGLCAARAAVRSKVLHNFSRSGPKFASSR